MTIHLVTGGARSGKSRHAEQLALSLGGDDVTYLATAEALDDEMNLRIEQHRARRPPAWQTLVAHRDLATVLRTIESHVVLLDCITLLASNVFLNEMNPDAAGRAVTMEIESLLAAAVEQNGELIVVTNEIGCGVVPENALARQFRDVLGAANQAVARAADSVTLMVCGMAVVVKQQSRLVT